MTHKEAVEKLAKLANGRHWNLTYEWASYFSANPHIRAYIAGPGHADPAQTYEGAIYFAEIMLGIVPADAPPEEDNTGGGAK